MRILNRTDGSPVHCNCRWAVRTRSKNPPTRASALELSRSALDLHVASRRILDRGQLAAADCPGRHLLAVKLLDPGLPIRPPGAGVLTRVFQPRLDFPRGWIAGPVLIADFGSGGVDDPGDMAGPGENEAHLS